MKKVIDGKMYNTDTAQMLGSWSNCDDAGNFDYCCETLYRKRCGELFLHGEGGARSEYAVSRGNGWFGGGESVIPLSIEEAQEWAEEHLTGEEYTEAFGEVPEDDGYVTTGLVLPVAVMRKAQKAADDSKIDLSAYLEKLILDADHNIA